jgi:arginyl-tRNA synthetase
MHDPKSVLKGILLEALRTIAPGASEALVHFERPRNPEHGDISCTVALTLARELKRKPR